MIGLMIEQLTTALEAAEAYRRAAWRVNMLLPVAASVDMGNRLSSAQA